MSSSYDAPDWVPRKRVAIVGGGAAGIAALYALNRTHHDAYLYEAADRLGGHANTVEWKRGKFRTVVDTGFMVFNAKTSPNFVNLLKNIDVATMPTEMSFSVSRDHGKFEWGGESLDAAFRQRWNHLLSLRMWRLAFDIVRFNQFAVDLLREEDEIYDERTEPSETISEYLDREGYSDVFRYSYLIPIVTSMWCTDLDDSALELPAAAFVRLMRSHNLIGSGASAEWRTLEGGAKSYIDRVMRGFPPNHLFLKTPVEHLTNDEDGRVRLHLENGRVDVFDHVILATHGDQAYRMIAPSATAEEEEILSAFRSRERRAILHSDDSFLPGRGARRAAAGAAGRGGSGGRHNSSLNYMLVSWPWTRRVHVERASLTYNMNVLQDIPRRAFGDVLVTVVNAEGEGGADTATTTNTTTTTGGRAGLPRPETVRARFTYAQPVQDAAAHRAQRALHRIQNTRGISYAGAWTRHGTHEDGVRSGLHAARKHLGARLPFELRFAESGAPEGRGGDGKDKGEDKSKGKDKDDDDDDWLRPSFHDRVMRLIVLVIQIFIVNLFDRVVRTRRQGGSSSGARARPGTGPRTGSGARTQAWTRPGGGGGGTTANGHANGHSHGHHNASIHTNGHLNGHANGSVNGTANGHTNGHTKPININMNGNGK